MLQASDLRGLCAMVPSFTTSDGGSMDARATVDVDLLRTGVERMIADGVDVLATTGTFGEVYNLLWEEQQVLIKAAVEVVAKRVPLFIGVTSPNPREVLDKMRFVREAGADGVLVGMPYYIPATPENAVQFFLDIAERFPDLAIMIYHNPTYHHITLPVPAVAKMAVAPNIVAMKDSHRDPGPFLKLMELTNHKLAIFVYQGQLYPYAQLGAAGCWSIGAWMGPWPLLALRDACAAGDWEQAQKIALDLTADVPLSDLRWRENSLKISINEAGYCQAGPLRPPFTHCPDDVVEAAKARGRRWREMAERYQAQRATAGAPA
ncbi:MAG TPA: dihydrodipicolinate synthase family protein [Chloroflexota bacterium]|nr:dihydrodipicolinate synthase family protein [Chloroflexota bacterium]